jgi:hypothetical protein
MRILILVISNIFLVPMSSANVQKLSIEWQVEHPFRLLRYKSNLQMHVDAFARWAARFIPPWMCMRISRITSIARRVNCCSRVLIAIRFWWAAMPIAGEADREGGCLPTRSDAIWSGR